MVKKVTWNNQAQDTFYEIAAYLEENYSEKTSQKFVQKIIDKIDVIQRYPTIGRKAPKRKTIRFILVEKHYRIYYRVHGNTLIISSLFYTKQHPDKDAHR